MDTILLLTHSEADGALPRAALEALSAAKAIGGTVTVGVFGGSTVEGNGALFDPATDGWTAISTAGSSPAAQRGSASVWTGSELVVWGGEGGATGARFTP
jgi:hypothetical protein